MNMRLVNDDNTSRPVTLSSFNDGSLYIRCAKTKELIALFNSGLFHVSFTKSDMIIDGYEPLEGQFKLYRNVILHLKK